MSDERPLSEHGARSTHEGGTVPGLQPIEVDREIQFRQLIWMGLGLVVVTMLSAVLVFFLLRGFLRSEREQAGPAPAMTAPPVVIPGPQLLARPEGELARVRELEKEQIEGYGWVDQQQGIVRIPIERALDLVAAQGLPSRPAPPATVPVDPAAAAAAETVAVPASPGEPAPADTGAAPAASPSPTAPGGHR
jgi:hypothetical protein